MLLLAFGWLFVNSQVAVASHDCPVEISAPSLSVQHSEHMLMKNHWDMVKAKGTLCDKHCIPDVMQKDKRLQFFGRITSHRHSGLSDPRMY